ncbi:MAG: hypothetical protein Q7J32_13385 [Sphingomonadaceae bacterium]|nr:hypothetical protein [Sphingomonadaceae bacterium]
MSLDWMDHLIALPVVLPLVASATMLLLKERRRKVKAAISVATVVALLVISLLLLERVVSQGFAGEPGARAYLLGNWPAPFGIVLVVDWLSALMLVLTSVLGLTSLA